MPADAAEIQITLPPTATPVEHQVPAEAATQILNELSSLWDARRSEAVTAHLEFRLLVTQPDAQQFVSPEFGRELVLRYRCAVDAEQFPLLAAALAGGASAEVFAGSPTTFITDGSSTRYDSNNFRQVRHFDLDLLYDGDNQQLDVYSRSQSGRLFGRMEDFRVVPDDTLDRSLWRVQAVTDDEVVLATSQGDARRWFDRSTGLQRREQLYRPETGELFRESWHDGIAHYPGGVPCPTCHVELNYHGGRLVNFWMRRLDTAEFNADLSAAAFEMSAPTGTKVFDHRGGGNYAFRTRDAFPNIATQLPTSVGNGTTALPASDSSRLRWLLAINGLCLVAAGIYLWRRDRHLNARTAAALQAEADPHSRNPYFKKEKRK